MKSSSNKENPEPYGSRHCDHQLSFSLYLGYWFLLVIWLLLSDLLNTVTHTKPCTCINPELGFLLMRLYLAFSLCIAKFSEMSCTLLVSYRSFESKSKLSHSLSYPKCRKMVKILATALVFSLEMKARK